MKSLLASLVIAVAACGSSTSPTAEDTSPAASPKPPVQQEVAQPAPSPEPTVEQEVTLEQAAANARRSAELLAELIASVEARTDCTQLVPIYERWETTHEQERERLTHLEFRIPESWKDGELSEHYSEINGYLLAMIDAIRACNDDPTVREVFGDTDEPIEEPLPIEPVLPAP